MSAPRKNILITNDDGIHGAGLNPLIKELKKLGNVTVIVPDHDRSAVSHTITLNRPLHVRKMKKNVFTVHGSPADCVRFGVIYVLKRNADLVISGINTGPNLGHDVIYSGTVAGAREGCLLNIPSFAVSVADLNKPNYPLSAKVSYKIASKILSNGLKAGIFINVNVPYKSKGIKVVSPGIRVYDDDIECRLDPRGRKYFWLAGKSISGILQAGMDITAVENGYVSVTPLELTPSSKHLFKTVEKTLK